MRHSVNEEALEKVKTVLVERLEGDKRATRILEEINRLREEHLKNPDMPSIGWKNFLPLTNGPRAQARAERAHRAAVLKLLANVSGRYESRILQGAKAVGSNTGLKSSEIKLLRQSVQPAVEAARNTKVRRIKGDKGGAIRVGVEIARSEHFIELGRAVNRANAQAEFIQNARLFERNMKIANPSLLRQVTHLGVNKKKREAALKAANDNMAKIQLCAPKMGIDGFNMPSRGAKETDVEFMGRVNQRAKETEILILKMAKEERVKRSKSKKRLKSQQATEKVKQHKSKSAKETKKIEDKAARLKEKEAKQEAKRDKQETKKEAKEAKKQKHEEKVAKLNVAKQEKQVNKSAKNVVNAVNKKGKAAKKAEKKLKSAEKKKAANSKAAPAAAPKAAAPKAPPPKAPVTKPTAEALKQQRDKPLPERPAAKSTAAPKAAAPKAPPPPPPKVAVKPATQKPAIPLAEQLQAAKLKAAAPKAPATKPTAGALKQQQDKPLPKAPAAKSTATPKAAAPKAPPPPLPPKVTVKPAAQKPAIPLAEQLQAAKLKAAAPKAPETKPPLTPQRSAINLKAPPAPPPRVPPAPSSAALINKSIAQNKKSGPPTISINKANLQAKAEPKKFNIPAPKSAPPPAAKMTSPPLGKTGGNMVNTARSPLVEAQKAKAKVQAPDAATIRLGKDPSPEDRKKQFERLMSQQSERKANAEPTLRTPPSTPSNRRPGGS